eukprot:CAMPEP_0169437490 /NCGR_PEP_ID=MMETSP1042-20121227/6157_1 /TAXON_ID=464988 /ORGANISM="Hemiselmis andersenii, Strain CCMP1180" /LENGTH=34 /DNA_ID= /DNA_START= /DNA_END= /DNA_ORIENTATION=
MPDFFFFGNILPSASELLELPIPASVLTRNAPLP